MSLEVIEKNDTLQQPEEKSFDDLVVEFYAWLPPQEKIWDEDQDQLADLFTEFLRSPLRAVPEATITHLQGELYTWMKHHPDRLHVLAKKLREPVGHLGTPLLEELPTWEKRVNAARMEHYGQPQPQQERARNKDRRQFGTTEMPLRD